MSVENKEIMSKNIKRLLIEKGASRKDLSEAINVPYTTVSDWINGKKYPRIDKIELLAEYFGVFKSSLVEEQSDMYSKYGLRPVKRVRVPLLGSVSCGIPKFADEEHATFVDIDESINADFCLQANGDSMIGANIYHGDYVFVKKQEAVNNGEIAVVVIDDEATLKKVYYYKDKNFLVLKAENPTYKDLTYSDEELDAIHILGKAVYVQHLL